MYWKLRLPLMLATFGVVAGLFDGMLATFLMNASYVERSASYLTIVGIIIYMLEKTGINEKRVHVSISVAIVLFGLIFEAFMLSVA
ncbi:hypothetical protein SAMN05421839_1596 [Halolactibacillus halophilus]|uniref:Uncharacterized protein n=1 Tax=Halolactibacillus halophilus TaxID=306540 RepID=A0A1I5T1U3_9BACI|nr:hypothetical protein [Halolactibacillus halophilus]GEM02866.1 hypothetical protein HHA03_23980 [Halolactibacillus halophilus]SFP77002.1 hypothetical protein SAMN05421839_1596 [Halolactibacillus halophilus]